MPKPLWLYLQNELGCPHLWQVRLLRTRKTVDVGPVFGNKLEEEDVFRDQLSFVFRPDRIWKLWQLWFKISHDLHFEKARLNACRFASSLPFFAHRVPLDCDLDQTVEGQKIPGVTKVI